MGLFSGDFTIFLIGAFIVAFSIGSSNTVDNVVGVDRSSNNTVVLFTSNGTNFVDQILNNTAVEIRVYP